MSDVLRLCVSASENISHPHAVIRHRQKRPSCRLTAHAFQENLVQDPQLNKPCIHFV